MAPWKEPTRCSKRQANQDPDHGPLNDPPKAKRPKATANGTKTRPSTSRNAKKGATTALVDLPRIAVSSKPTEIASPFTELGEPPVGDWTFKETDLYRYVRDIYLMVQNAGTAAAGDFEKVGGAAFVRWVRLRDDDIGEGGCLEQKLLCTRPIMGETWVGEKAEISWDDQVSYLSKSKRGKATALRATPVRRAAEIFRVGQGDEEKEFFFWWHNSREISVNRESVIGPEDDPEADVAIGPLPEFCVIRVQDTIIFFWKNVTALRYTPDSVEADLIRIQKQAEADAKKLDEALLGELFDEEPEGSDPPAVKEEVQQVVNNDQETKDEQKRKERIAKWHRWWQIWNEGMKRHRAAVPARDPDPKMDEKQSHFLKSYAMLPGDSVLFAIASVWRTMKEAKHQCFSLNSFSMYQLARWKKRGDQTKIAPAILGPNDLLIPMTFDTHYQSPPNSGNKDALEKGASTEGPPPKQDKPEGDGQYVGKGGHTILVVARRTTEDSLSIRIMDSCPRVVDRFRIINSVRRTIQFIGWLGGMDDHGLAVELPNVPNIEVDELDVVFQRSADSCGVHAILNAWIHMIGLPALNQMDRIPIIRTSDGKAEEARFMNSAVEIINLAMAGYMDLRTIQAFFNHFGFCQLQDPEIDCVDEDRTTMMQSSELNRILGEERDEKMKAQIEAFLAETGEITHEETIKVPHTETATVATVETVNVPATTTANVPPAETANVAPTEPETAPSTQTAVVPQAAIDQVMRHTGRSHGGALYLLDVASGNVDLAVSLHLSLSHGYSP
ncbi:MAG: hypothetical protein Q9166_006892 [cf. Caloplaca sp. 2 TL-2023]